MNRRIALTLFFLLTGGCQVQDIITGRYSGPMPNPVVTCGSAAYSNFYPSNILEKTYNHTFGNDSVVINASYADGIYLCDYSVSNDYTTTDAVNTYRRHAVYTVGVRMIMDMASDTPANTADATYQIYMPLQKVSDVVTAQINTTQLQKETQEGNVEEQRQKQQYEDLLIDAMKQQEQREGGDPCEQSVFGENTFVCSK